MSDTTYSVRKRTEVVIDVGEPYFDLLIDPEYR